MNRPTWQTIWLHPRETIRRIVETNPRHAVLPLATGFGVAQTISNLQSQAPVDLPVTLALCVMGGALGGLIMLYLEGFLLAWSGVWLGGEASLVQLRAAIAWSKGIPAIGMLLLSLCKLLLFGRHAFMTDLPMAEGEILRPTALLVISGAQLILGVWTIVLYLQCVREVQHFSLWRALANSILSALPFLLAMIFLASVVMLNTGKP